MQAQTVNPADTTVYCPRCGRPMLIAPQHAYTLVACPHCQSQLEPWRVQAVAHEAQTTPYPSPPPPPPVRFAHSADDGYSWRNRWIAGALGILLGTFGVHRFYLGHTGMGIFLIVVCIFTLGTVSAVWGFIEGILCFCGAMTDVDGRPLSG